MIGSWAHVGGDLPGYQRLSVRDGVGGQGMGPTVCEVLLPVFVFWAMRWSRYLAVLYRGANVTAESNKAVRRDIGARRVSHRAQCTMEMAGDRRDMKW